MKKLLLAYLLVWGTALTLSAQVVINPKAGLHFTNLEASGSSFSLEGTNGFQAGIDLRIGNKDLYFNPGVHYFTNKNEVLARVAGVDLSGESRIQQLRLPVAVGLRLTPRENMLALRAKAGVQPAFRLNVEELGELPLVEEDVRTFRTDVLLGVGLDLALLFTLDIQYAVGIQEYLEDGSGTESYFLISAGFKFGRGKALYGR